MQSKVYKNNTKIEEKTFHFEYLKSKHGKTGSLAAKSSGLEKINSIIRDVNRGLGFKRLLNMEYYELNGKIF